MVCSSTLPLLGVLESRIRDVYRGTWPTSVPLHQGLIAFLVSVISQLWLPVLQKECKWLQHKATGSIVWEISEVSDEWTEWEGCRAVHYVKLLVMFFTSHKYSPLLCFTHLVVSSPAGPYDVYSYQFPAPLQLDDLCFHSMPLCDDLVRDDIHLLLVSP
jgi:hypothetical protein